MRLHRHSLSTTRKRATSTQLAVPILVALLLLVLPSQNGPFLLGVVHAYQTGAGACPAGGAAVGGGHLDASNGRTVQTGELYQGGVSVTLSNIQSPLIPMQAVTIATQTEYTLTVATTTEPGFKGILLRLGSSGNDDDNNAMTIQPTDATILQEANACTTESNAVGVTHVDNTPKLSVSAVVRFDAPGTVALDITLVGANLDTISVYGYNGFVLDVQGEAAVVAVVTTGAPVATTATPLAPGETRSPSASPTVSDIMGTPSPTYTINLAASANANPTTTTTSASSSSRTVTATSWWLWTSTVLAMSLWLVVGRI
jgi:hypothetical protein